MNNGKQQDSNEYRKQKYWTKIIITRNALGSDIGYFRELYSIIIGLLLLK